MIAHIYGVVEHIDKNFVVVDVNGIGYNIFISTNFLSRISGVGNKIKIFTEQIVKEDSISLYGFETKEEKNLFNALLSVSGIGPKSALSLISGLPVEKLVSAITSGDASLISSIPGIGNKTAQRIIVELKEKMAKTYGVTSIEMAKGMFGETNLISDAISALVTLGYSPKESRDMLLKLDLEKAAPKNIEEIIKIALKSLL